MIVYMYKETKPNILTCIAGTQFTMSMTIINIKMFWKDNKVSLQ